MTGFLHTILMRVTLAGIASAVALRLAGNGPVREAVKLAAGLLMLLALLQPLPQLKAAGFKGLWEYDGMTVSGLEEQNMQTVMSTVAASIAESAEQRAADEGIECEIVVTMGNDEDGLLQISHVTVYYHERDEGRLDELRALLLRECGVDEGRQELIAR